MEQNQNLKEKLSSNLGRVEANVVSSCKKVGRDPSEVTLIAVSKTKPVEMLQDVYDCGIRAFGENYVQELVDKIEVMPKDIEWHMIGHLQRNKVKYIVGKVKMIHSVDTIKLAEEISRLSVKNNCTTEILLEVNVAKEENKFGFTVEEAPEAVMEISKLPNIVVRGLMTSAPYVEDPEENRKHFSQLRQLCVDINDKNIDNINMDMLSMGMTNDYEVAVEEGATMVRVGTAIFGERNYNK